MFSKSNLSNNKFRNTLNELRWEKCLCDVVLVTGLNVEFPAHKNILSASSPHFRQMFKSGCIAPQMDRVSLENVNPFAFSELINYAYTGEINVTTDNAQIIFITSQLLQFNELLDLCIEVIGENIELENCLNIYEFTTKYDDLVDLDGKTINFICENISDVIKTEAFSTLSLTQVQKLLNRTKSIINQEELIFDGIRKWIVQKNEKEEIGIFFRFLNFSKISYQYLQEFIDEASFAQNGKTSTDIIEFLLPIVKKRKTNGKDFFVFTCRDFSGDMFIRAFDIKKEKWLKIIPLGSHQKNSKLAILDNKLYILSRTKKLDEYNLDTNAWSKKAPLINEIDGDVKLIILNNKIYAHNKTAWALFEPKINKWTSELLFKDVNNACSLFSVASNSDHIFFIGGMENAFTNTIRLYNIITKKCNKNLYMKTERCCHANVVINDRLYILGGLNKQAIPSKSMEIFDISKNKWQENVMEMPIERYDHLAAVYESEIFVFGGRGSLNPIEQIDVYDSMTNQWRTLDEKSPTDNFLTSVVLVNSDITKISQFSL